MKRIVMLGMIFMLALVSTSFAEITLKGKVTDAKSGKALIGANVLPAPSVPVPCS